MYVTVCVCRGDLETHHLYAWVGDTGTSSQELLVHDADRELGLHDFSLGQVSHTLRTPSCLCLLLVILHSLLKSHSMQLISPLAVKNYGEIISKFLSQYP